MNQYIEYILNLIPSSVKIQIDQYIKYIFNLIPAPVKIRATSPPPWVPLGIMYCLFQVILYIDIEKLARKVKAHYKTELVKKLTGRKLEPIKLEKLPVYQPEKPMEDAIKTKNVKSMALSRLDIHNQYMEKRIDYLLSVTPSQYLRDRKQVLDLMSTRSLANSSNSTFATLDLSSNPSFDIFDPYIDLTEEEKKQLISSPSVPSVEMKKISCERIF